MNDTFKMSNLLQKKDKKEKKNRSLYQRMLRVFMVYLILSYPFTIVGSIFFFFYRTIARKIDKEHEGEFQYQKIVGRYTNQLIVIAIALLIVNFLVFVFLIPSGYFSAYLIFPFNLFENSLVFNSDTILALLMAGFTNSFLFASFYSFRENRKVVSLEDEMNKIKQTKEYIERRDNRFAYNEKLTNDYNLKFKEAVRLHSIEQLNFLQSNIFLGHDEFGKVSYVSLAELNQHLLLNATTGAGKTTILRIIINHCAMYGLPCLYINGKGDLEMEEIIYNLASKYERPMKSLTDYNQLRYNVVKHGNSVAIRDRLSQIAETESIFYSGANKALLMGTIQFLDIFEIKRTLHNVLDYLEPYRVLERLFLAIHNGNESKIPSKNSQNYNRFSDEPLAVVSSQANSEVPTDIDDLYSEVKKKKDHLTPPQAKIFSQLFSRYEIKDSGYLYLYKTVEALQISIGLLLDSEIGYLFDTSEPGNEELDLFEDTIKDTLIYVSLDGLVYQEYIAKLAHFLTSDLNYMASQKYRKKLKNPLFVLFDEPSTYLSKLFIDTLNKTRGAGIHAVVSPQSLGDIEQIDPILLKRLIDNVNTFMVGQTNDPDYVEQLSSLMGTYQDYEVTTMIEQAEGQADVNRQDWQGERGTRKRVSKFTIHPDTIKGLRTGEYALYRKGNNFREEAKVIYARNP